MVKIKGLNRKRSTAERKAEPVKQIVSDVTDEVKVNTPTHPQVYKFIERIKKGMELNPSLGLLIQNERSR
ncbi:MAG: hypothetical protein WA152_00935 [Microgenomates group bacterium]